MVAYIQQGGISIVDVGNAPEYYVDGLARVINLSGSAEFLLYRKRPLKEPGEFELHHALSVIMPIEAIGPAIEMTLLAVPGLVWPAIGYAARRLVS